MVLPLAPEFITPQDGAEKQDCERNAAKRWLGAHQARVADLRPVYLGDALFSCQPLAEAVLATGADFLFVVKKDGHKTLYEFIDGAPLDQRIVTERKPGKRNLTQSGLSGVANAAPSVMGHLMVAISTDLTGPVVCLQLPGSGCIRGSRSRLTVDTQ
jgi:hypothetical protein